MSASVRVGPFPHNSSSSEDKSEIFVLNSFKIKTAGTGGTRNTLVDTDSLSSYSWPDETRKNGTSRPQGEKTTNGATQDVSHQLMRVGNEQGSLIFKTSRKDHVVIEIDDIQDNEPAHDLSYLEAYMKVMYWTCTSPFNPAKQPNVEKTSWTDPALNVSQKVCFTVFIAMSLLQSFFLVKFFVLYNLEYGGLENFVDMFFIMMLVTKLYYVYKFIRHQKKFRRLLVSRYKLREFRKRIQQTNLGLCSTMTYGMILGVTSILVSLTIAIWTAGVMNWTPQLTLLYHSDSFATGLFIWTQEQMNQTCINAYEEQYGVHVTTTNLIFGLIGLIIHLCGSIHMDTVANLMLTNSKTLQLEMGEINMKICNEKNDVKNISLSEFLREDGDWAHLQLVKSAVSNDNDAFNSLMKFEHVYNLMLFVFFALNLFDGDYGWVYIGHLLYKIVKASYTYRVAANAASLNDSAKDWIQRLAWKTTDKIFLDRVPLLLYELEKKPIGMGRGQFLVDERFLYRFLGMIGSVFILEADAKETNRE